MKAVDGCGKLDNVAEAGTNIGGMLEHVRQTMAGLPISQLRRSAFRICWPLIRRCQSA